MIEVTRNRIAEPISSMTSPPCNRVSCVLTRNLLGFEDRKDHECVAPRPHGAEAATASAGRALGSRARAQESVATRRHAEAGKQERAAATQPPAGERVRAIRLTTR